MLTGFGYSDEDSDGFLDFVYKEFPKTYMGMEDSQIEGIAKNYLDFNVTGSKTYSKYGYKLTNLQYYNTSTKSYDLIDMTVVISDINITRTDYSSYVCIKPTPQPNLYLFNTTECKVTLNYYYAGTSKAYTVNTNFTMYDIDDGQYFGFESGSDTQYQYTHANTILKYVNTSGYNVFYEDDFVVYGDDDIAITSAGGTYSASSYTFVYGNNLYAYYGNTTTVTALAFFGFNNSDMCDTDTPDPTKSVSDTDNLTYDKQEGEEIEVEQNRVENAADTWTYTITQLIPAGKSEKYYYDSFIFIDEIDSCLTIEDVAIVRNEGTKDITHRFDITTTNNVVTATAKSGLLQGTGSGTTNFYGGQYGNDIQMVVTVSVGADLDTVEAHGHRNGMELTFTNQGKTIITCGENTYGDVTGTTTTVVDLPDPVIDKKASQYEWSVGDQVEYTITVKNQDNDSAMGNVLVTDSSLPESLLPDADGITVTGVTGDPEITYTDDGFTVLLPKIEKGGTATITVLCTATQDSDGSVIENTVDLTMDLVDDDDDCHDSERIWVNSPVLNIEKTVSKENCSVSDIVDYTLTIENVQPGTIARNLTISDILDNEGASIVDGSIVVYDANGSEITDAVVTLIDGGFTVKNLPTLRYNGTAPFSRKISTNVNNASLETAALTEWNAADTKYVIKYQVSFDEASLESYVVNNTAVVSSDNSDPDDDTATVNITSVSRTVKKEWEDQDNKYSLRPSSIEVTLMNGTTEVSTVTLTTDKWTATVENLPAYDADGELISYTWKEESVTGYSSSQTTDANTGVTTIINTLRTTSKTVKKVWEDDDNSYKVRPDSVNVELLDDSGNSYGTVTLKGDSWSGTISNIPVYDKNGNEINYTWKETVPEGYGATYSTDSDGITTITNKIVKGSLTTSKTVMKVWNDGDSSSRPNSVSITLMNEDTEISTVELNDNNNWTDAVENLPLYDADGNEIPYSWKEIDVPGYKVSYSDEVDGTTTVTNTLLVSKTVKKEWDDNGDAYGLRPASVNASLSSSRQDLYTGQSSSNVTTTNSYVDSETKETVITSIITETASITGVLPAGLTKEELDAMSMEVTVYDNDLKQDFTDYIVDTAIDYDDADGSFSLTINYDTSSQLDITNNTTVTVVFYKEGTIETVELNEGNGWSATVESLPLCDSNGKLIEYTWTEDDWEYLTGDEATGYVASYETDTDGTVVITNTCNGNLQLGSITLTKRIDPDSLGNISGDATFDFTLTGTDVVYEETKSVTFTSSEVLTLTPDADGYVSLSATFDGLAYGTYTAKESGMEESYQLDDIEVEGYATVTSGSLKNPATAAITIGKDSTDEKLYLTGSAVFTNQNISNSIKLIKYDTDGKTLLKGTTFAIVDSNGKTIESLTTDEKGEVVFENLPNGDYQIIETSTVAGHSLLTEPLNVTMPLTMTSADAEKYNAELTNATYSASEDMYYFHSLTYNVTNSYALDMPYTGSKSMMVYAFLSGLALIFVGLYRSSGLKKQR